MGRGQFFEGKVDATFAQQLLLGSIQRRRIVFCPELICARLSCVVVQFGTGNSLLKRRSRLKHLPFLYSVQHRQPIVVQNTPVPGQRSILELYPQPNVTIEGVFALNRRFAVGFSGFDWASRIPVINSMTVIVEARSIVDQV
jgi:hypothetical protein